MERELFAEMPFEVKFTATKGYPETRFEPSEHPEIEIEEITLFGVAITVHQEEAFIKEYGLEELEQELVRSQ